MHIHLAVFAAAALAQYAITQGTLTLPPQALGAEANSYNSAPLGGGTSFLIQDVYGRVMFTSQGVSDPILVTQLAWRPDSTIARTWPATTLQGVTIHLSTCARDVATLGIDIAANRGADRTLVFGGTVNYPAGSTTPPGPAAALVQVTLSTPFLYDPLLGDLLVEVDVPATGPGQVPPLALDFAIDNTAMSLQNLPAARVVAWHPAVGVAPFVNRAVASVLQIGWQPAPGLHPRFEASVVAGLSPLSVQFFDRSYTSAAGGVTNRAWDFDNDGITDATGPSPTWVFTTCGGHTVRLTVQDGVHAPETRVATDFIVTDAPVVDFNWTQVVPGVYQFLDTTLPTPTAWAWDFDNDGVVDDTTQNPVRVLQGHAQHVKLTATVACHVASVTKEFVNAASVLPTFTTVNNGLSNLGAGNLFELAVTAPEGISIGGLTVMPYTQNAPGTPFRIEVWVSSRTDVATAWAEPEVWRLGATGTTHYHGGAYSPVMPGAFPHEVAFDEPLLLPMGNYGVAVFLQDSGIAYQTLTGGPTTFGNADLAVTLGAAVQEPFGGYYPPFLNRGFSGAIHYTPCASGCPGDIGFLGAGCAGSAPVAQWTMQASPRIGTTMQATLTNVPLSVAVLVGGVDSTHSAFGPLPLDLALIGAPGCAMRVSLDAAQALTGAGQTVQWSFVIPNDPLLLAVRLFAQALVFDPGANTLGAVASDAIVLVVGP